MSKYRAYGKKLDDLAKKSFSDYEMAKAHYEKARRDYKSMLNKTGIAIFKDSDYVLKRKKKEIAFMDAEKNFKEAQKIYKNTIEEANELRTALYNELQKDLSINPEDLDQNTVALLSSGVCTAREIADLFEKADNVTTKRYISKFAHDKINDDPRDEGASILTEVVHSGRKLTNPDVMEPMQRFDSALNVFNRCVNNPSMIGYWEQLTEETFSNM